jgi:PAS domain-containing protein
MAARSAKSVPTANTPVLPPFRFIQLQTVSAKLARVERRRRACAAASLESPPFWQYRFLHEASLMSTENESARGFVRLGDQRLSEDVYQKLLDAAPDAVIVVDESGRIVLANIQMERLFGYHRDELIG